VEGAVPVRVAVPAAICPAAPGVEGAEGVVVGTGER